jgi:hypothetical protein
MMGKREIAIERGIPIPGPKKAVGPRTPITRAAATMAVGESIFCDTLAERDSVRQLVRRLGGQSVSRKMANEVTSENGYRVWRIG